MTFIVAGKSSNPILNPTSISLVNKLVVNKIRNITSLGIGYLHAIHSNAILSRLIQSHLLHLSVTYQSFRLIGITRHDYKNVSWPLQ